MTKTTKLKTPHGRENAEKWLKGLDLIEEVIEKSREVLRKKHLLGLAFWQRYHAVNGTNFKRLSKKDKSKLFDEFSRWYSGAFGKLYRPSGTAIRSQNIKEFVHRMDVSMPKILEQLKKE